MVTINKATLDRKIGQIQKALDKSKVINNEAFELLKSIRSGEKSYSSISTKLKKLVIQSDELSGELSSNMKLLNTLTKSMQKFHDGTFLPCKEKIEDKENGLNAVLKKSTELNRKIKKEDGNINKLISAINVSRENFQEIIKEISLYKVEANTELKQIQKVRIKAVDAGKHIEGVKNNANAAKSILSKHREEITSFHKESKVALDGISKKHQEAGDLNDKVGEIYGIIANRSLAGAFDIQKAEYKLELEDWKKKTLLATQYLLLLVLGIFLTQICFNDFCLDNLGHDFYLRFILAAPLVYYLYFCSTQYKYARKSVDRYAYKKAVSLSVESHTELLVKKFGINNEKEILNFLLDSFDKVYEEPDSHEKLKIEVKKEKYRQKGHSLEDLLFSKDSQLSNLLEKLTGLVNKIKSGG